MLGTGLYAAEGHKCGIGLVPPQNLRHSGRVTNPVELDALDRVLVGELQRDARITLTELAHRAHLGLSATRTRVRRLEESGVLAGYRARVPPAAVGLHLHAVVRMKVHGALFDQVDAVIAEEPQIVRCLRITGESCYHMEVLARDVADLQRITMRLARVGSVTTDLVYETVTERGTPLGGAPG
ncbi:Lrp/AsnC family transcriptional regulator, leucine-responsive regulatory protein [Nocardiopsis flavescens]|uniref:Lrp/AsnC family transcriptional regulator, leucine-responsive regulatory protein n=1 Tax=Nocardiopsis flavescens TaxID=758803 RepID=A0A1M6M3C0_9ACTN|nr:Lrp/AsnC family transcriptional regulator, leucine-responsive regulatory protein [Nocardiopsis flavescens]